jgi:uncharacterized protein (TIGR00369 family)
MSNIESDPFGNAPISQLIGLEVVPEGEHGVAVVYLNVGARMHNPMGFVQGGVLSLLADAAMGIAFGRTLDEKHSFATIELKTNYIRPIKEGRLRAVGTLIQRGLRVGFLECRVHDHRKRLIATASCTCTVNTLGPA